MSLLILCGFLGSLASPLRFGFGQELPTDPRIEVQGPEGQPVYVVVQYYDNSERTKSVTKRLTLEAEGLEEQLEFGHQGIRVVLISPTKETITVALRDGQRVLQEATSSKIGNIKIKLGVIPETDEFSPPRVLPSASERKLVEKMLQAIAEADTQDLVADSPSASIQWQTLNAFSVAMQRQLGDYVPDPELDGWLSWSGNLNTRVLSGPCHFSNGTCWFTLVLFDGLLWNVEAECDLIPEDWFNGPADEEAYVRKAAELSVRLFDRQIEGQLADIRSLFAPQYREDVTPENLRELSKDLQNRYGTQPEAALHVKSELETASASPEDVEATRDFRVFHLLQLPQGKECITQVDFVFTSRGDNIGRGDLASIQVRNSWPSEDAASAKIAAAFLRKLSEQQPIIETFHPEVCEVLDEEEFEAAVTRLREQLGPLTVTPELSIWEARQIGSHLIAQGKANFEHGVARIQFDFSASQLVAVTVTTPTLAWQSNAFLEQQEELSRLASEFWEHLFEGNAMAAHSLLAPRFQERLSVGELEALVRASDFAGASNLEQIVTDQVIISTRTDRPLPVLVAVYQVVNLESGVQQPLRTEFQNTDAGWELLNFNSDFQATFVSNKPHQQFDLLQEYLAQQESQGFISLLDDELATAVMPAILDGFLSKAASVLDTSQIPEQFSCLHEYRLGTRYERLASQWKTAKGHSTRLEATFRMEKLLSFAIRSDELAFFVEHVGDLGCFDRLAKSVTEQWMAGDFEAASNEFVPELKDGKLADRLRRLKSTLLITHGPFRESWLTYRKVLPDSNSVECWLALEFQQAIVPLKITLEADAFRARISGFEPSVTGG